MTRKPQGVVAILTGSDGHVWATATDFDQSGSGGFTWQEAQELRAKRQVSTNFLRSTCNSFIANVISDYQRDEIMRKLCHENGFKLTVVRIGYGEESQP